MQKFIGLSDRSRFGSKILSVSQTDSLFEYRSWTKSPAKKKVFISLPETLCPHTGQDRLMAKRLTLVLCYTFLGRSEVRADSVMVTRQSETRSRRFALGKPRSVTVTQQLSYPRFYFRIPRRDLGRNEPS